MPGSIRRTRQTLDIWPGFVDVMSSLLIIIIFLLMVFTLSQFFLGQLLSGKTHALDQLTRQVAQLSQMLALEKSKNADLQDKTIQLSTDLAASVATRERLSSQLAELMPEKDALEAQLTERTEKMKSLQTQLDTVIAENRTTKEELDKAQQLVTADKDKIEAQLAEIAQLNRDVTALKKVRDDLEKKVAGLAATVTANTATITSLRDRSKELEARLSTEQERTALAQKEIQSKDLKIRELSAQAQRVGEELTAEQHVSAQAQRQVTLLNRQIEALRQQLARLNAALDASEAKVKEQHIQIVNLGSRLNQALASKVAELARYRSEFFGRLRQVLGDQKGIRIVGDRFVFQSEVLFPTASADLNPGGVQQIQQLAETLIKISKHIPKGLNWVLRVDGHTDRRPINTPQFPSNWELSSARAIAVVKQLIADGVPADRLVAAGFGQYQPIDPGNSEAAYSRNRRIEFKLTQR